MGQERGRGSVSLSEAQHVYWTWWDSLESTQRPQAGATWPPSSGTRDVKSDPVYAQRSSIHAQNPTFSYQPEVRRSQG